MKILYESLKMLGIAIMLWLPVYVVCAVIDYKLEPLSPIWWLLVIFNGFLTSVIYDILNPK